MRYQTLFVTGASGLLGSNICQLAVRQGRRVKAMVRNAADAETLAAAGVEPFLCDLDDVRAMQGLMAGTEAIVHSAALIGGTWSTGTPADFERVNYHGTRNLLEAATGAGVSRILLVATMAILDSTFTVTETTPLAAIDPPGSHYMRTKLAAYHAAMAWAAMGGNVSTIFPGAMYGPSLFVDRALHPTLFTGSLYYAIRGELSSYVRFPMTWPHAEDVASIALAALDKGKNGGRYLAAGAARDTLSLAEFCNLGCEIAGVPHRVRDLGLEDCGPEIGAIRHMAERKFADPLVNDEATRQALGTDFRPVEQGVAETVAWLRANGRI